jgi:hypothetical protein
MAAANMAERWPEHVNGALEERVLAALAAEQLQPVAARKHKTAYQLFHKHRAAELRETTPGGMKHHEAFKRAARDWTAMPKVQRDFYVRHASVKPSESAPPTITIANDLSSWPEFPDQLLLFDDDAPDPVFLPRF